MTSAPIPLVVVSELSLGFPDAYFICGFEEWGAQCCDGRPDAPFSLWGVCLSISLPAISVLLIRIRPRFFLKVNS